MLSNYYMSAQRSNLLSRKVSIAYLILTRTLSFFTVGFLAPSSNFSCVFISWAKAHSRCFLALLPAIGLGLVYCFLMSSACLLVRLSSVLDLPSSSTWMCKLQVATRDMSLILTHCNLTPSVEIIQFLFPFFFLVSIYYLRLHTRLLKGVSVSLHTSGLYTFHSNQMET